jgi:hypothetical protein
MDHWWKRFIAAFTTQTLSIIAASLCGVLIMKGLASYY